MEEAISFICISTFYVYLKSYMARAGESVCGEVWLDRNKG